MKASRLFIRSLSRSYMRELSYDRHGDNKGKCETDESTLSRWLGCCFTDCVGCLKVSVACVRVRDSGSFEAQKAC